VKSISMPLTYSTTLVLPLLSAVKWPCAPHIKNNIYSLCATGSEAVIYGLRSEEVA